MAVFRRLLSTIVGLSLVLLPAGGVAYANPEDGQPTAGEGAASSQPASASDALVSEEQDADAADGEAPSAGQDSAAAPAAPDETAETSPDASAEDESGQGVSADGTDAVSGTYLLRFHSSNVHVLDVADGRIENGSNVQIYESNMTAGQRFTIETVQKDGATFCRILVSADGATKALDVADAVAEKGTNVQIYEPNGTDGQLWRAERAEDGSYVFHSALDDRLVLDVADGLAANGVNVRIWEENGAPAQRFWLTDLDPVVPTDTVEPGYYRLAFALDDSKVADVRDGSIADGARLQLCSRNAMTAQIFKIEQLPSGYYAIRAVNSGKAVDVRRGNVVATTEVQTWDCDSAPGKEWAVRTNEDGTVTFLSAVSGLALDVPDASPVDGAGLQVYYDNGSSAQKWRLEPAEPSLSEGVYTITVPLLSSTRALDVDGSSADAGGNVQIWTRNDSPAQKFSVEATEAGTYRFQALCSGLYLSVDGRNVVQNALGAPAQEWTLEFAWGGYVVRNVATGLVLDVSDAGGFDGCNVGVYEENGTVGQAFSFLSAPAMSAGVYTVRSACGGLALDVANGSISNGANVQLWTANGTGAQIWRMVDAGDGWFYIVNAKSGLALDVADGSSVPGANVRQWPSNGSNAQKWRFVPTGDGWYAILSACGGLALDVADGASFDGVNVQVYTTNGANAQKFRVFRSADYSISGDPEFDRRITAFVAGCTDDGMSSYEKLNACYRRVIQYPYRTMAHEPWGSTDWSQWRALDMIDNGSGNCYNYAALFMWCARCLGYDAQVVSGGVPSASRGIADHGWVEVYLDGGTYVCDPDLATNYPTLNWFMRTYANAPIVYYR